MVHRGRINLAARDALAVAGLPVSAAERALDVMNRPWRGVRTGCRLWAGRAAYAPPTVARVTFGASATSRGREEARSGHRPTRLLSPGGPDRSLGRRHARLRGQPRPRPALQVAGSGTLDGRAAP